MAYSQERSNDTSFSPGRGMISQEGSDMGAKDSKKPNILILMSNNEIGGITSSTLALFKSFSGNVEVSAAYFGPDRQLQKKREYLVQLRTPQFPSNLKFFKFIFRLTNLLKLIRKIQPTVIICQDPSTSLISYVCRLFFPRVKIIGMCHVPHKLLSNLDKMIIKNVFPRLHKVVVPSKFIADELSYLKKSQDLVVIPNSVSEEVTSCKWPRNLEIKQGFLLFLGRLEKEKNPNQIVSMAASDPTSNYVICGDGSEMETLRKRKYKENLNNVTFLGYQDASEILNIASVVIIPSFTESFGVIAIESWLHGIPTLVSSSAEGILELIISEDLGVLLSLEEDIEVLTKQSGELAKSRVSDQSISIVLDAFHHSTQFKKWMDVIA